MWEIPKKERRKSWANEIIPYLTTQIFLFCPHDDMKFKQQQKKTCLFPSLLPSYRHICEFILRSTQTSQQQQKIDVSQSSSKRPLFLSIIGQDLALTWRKVFRGWMQTEPLAEGWTGTFLIAFLFRCKDNWWKFTLWEMKLIPISWPTIKASRKGVSNYFEK